MIALGIRILIVNVVAGRLVENMVFLVIGKKFKNLPTDMPRVCKIRNFSLTDCLSN